MTYRSSNGCSALTDEQISHADKRVELSQEVQDALESSPLYNHDLAPVWLKTATGAHTTMLLCGFRCRHASLLI